MRYLKLSNNTLLPLSSQLPINDTYQFVFTQTDEEFVTTTLPLLKVPANMIDLEVVLADKKTTAIKDIHGYTVYTGYSSVEKDGETLITVTMCKEVKDIEKRLATTEDQLTNKIPQIVESANQAVQSANDAVTQAKQAVDDCGQYTAKVEELDKQINPVIDFEKMSLEEAKEYKWNEMNETCNQIIENGIDVTYKDKVSHYRLTSADQTNLSTYNTEILAAIAMSGLIDQKQITTYLESVKFLYHADGEDCREYTANEITEIATAAKKFVTYHTTLINKIHKWINREEDKAIVLAITYGYAQMPEDLRTEMDALLSSVSSDTTADEVVTDGEATSAVQTSEE